MNISKTFLLGGMLAGSLALLQPASGQAQYTGPSTHHAPATVAEILKNPVDDQDVVLRGHLLRKVGNEKYIFSAGTDRRQGPGRNPRRGGEGLSRQPGDRRGGAAEAAVRVGSWSGFRPGAAWAGCAQAG